MIFIYRLITFLLYPFFIILIYLRKYFNKEENKRFKEKIFSSSFQVKKNDSKKLLWFHAASIGEVQSIFPIIEKFDKESQDLEFLVTTVTLSAANIVKKRFNLNPKVHHRYFPIDVYFLTKNFLNRWRPDLILFVDSEIWPNLIFEIKKREIPLVLVNGRITKKTFNKWKLLSGFAKNIFSKFDLCLAASQESQQNLKDLNVKNLKFIGNIKFSGEVDSNKLIDKNIESLKQNKFWCAASTHEGEEIVCLEAHLNLKKKFINIKTVIIPRHINRSKQIRRLCDKLNLSSQILNHGDKIQDNSEIIIVNSFGSLSKFFNYSDSVFIGKSLLKKLKKVGGQNPIEAAKLGCKIYHGPYIYNFKEIYDLLGTCKISEEIHDSKTLCEKLTNDFNNLANNPLNEANRIDELGKKILNNTVKEIGNFLKR